MTTPTVHLNGTGRAALAEQYAAAYAALGEALTVLCAAAPNARDYYVQAPGAFTVAQDEHEARLRAVETVRNDMLALYRAVEG